LYPEVSVVNYPELKNKILIEETQKEEITTKKQNEFIKKTKILNEIEIILPQNENILVTASLIKSLELSIYKKKIHNISLNVNRYRNLNELETIINKTAAPGKIYIGPLATKEMRKVHDHCYKGVLFFSFAAEKKLGKDCVYLINFFPEDDLKALFNFFPDNSKIALLYPENSYGYYINAIIDAIAVYSNSLIINRVSYREDLTNARDAIKELSKYELRKFELERQKKILRRKDDPISKKAFKKIEKFETVGQVDFTHLILPDYSIRLLEIAPLLPFYDVDPNIVQFVGTGVWDDEIFFDEPSLQGSIFPGIEKSERDFFIEDYQFIYQEKPIRTATIPYDLLGILFYIFENKMNLEEVYDLLDNGQIIFEGIDGKFSFVNNIISRELDILQISQGKAIRLN